MSHNNNLDISHSEQNKWDQKTIFLKKKKGEGKKKKSPYKSFQTGVST